MQKEIGLGRDGKLCWFTSWTGRRQYHNWKVSSSPESTRTLKLTRIVDWFLFLEKLDSRVTPDSVLLCKVCLLCGVDLGQLDLRAILLQSLGSPGILGGQRLAVAAPRSVCGGDHVQCYTSCMQHVAL